MKKSKRGTREEELANRLERIKLAIEKGITGNIQTGEVFNRKGKLITGENVGGYVQIGFNYNGKVKILKAHHFIWYLAYGEVVDCIDHINGIKTDNRISQLRSVTYQENQWNQTKAKGYSWNKAAQKWLARIKVDVKHIYLGLFVEEEDARNAYLAAKEKYHNI